MTDNVTDEQVLNSINLLQQSHTYRSTSFECKTWNVLSCAIFNKRFTFELILLNETLKSITRTGSAILTVMLIRVPKNPCASNVRKKGRCIDHRGSKSDICFKYAKLNFVKFYLLSHLFSIE